MKAALIGFVLVVAHAVPVVAYSQVSADWEPLEASVWQWEQEFKQNTFEGATPEHVVFIVRAKSIIESVGSQAGHIGVRLAGLERVRGCTSGYEALKEHVAGSIGGGLAMIKVDFVNSGLSARRARSLGLDGLYDNVEFSLEVLEEISNATILKLMDTSNDYDWAETGTGDSEETGVEKPIPDNQAVEYCTDRLESLGYYSEITINCLSFSAIASTPEYIDVEAREIHGGECGGDPQTAPRRDLFRVYRKDGTIDWYDVVEDGFLPLREAKYGEW